NMIFSTALCGLLLLLNAHFFNAYPVSSDSLTRDDLDVLKTLLLRLEATLPEPKETAPFLAEKAGDVDAEDSYDQPQARQNQAQVEQFLSARDLKAVRSGSTSRSSGCFGRRLDRIGSMSSLGCNTNPKNDI
uniref:Natriuretic peptide B n=1 Tax=Scleropages formosus TaxID=113540 RepID=A0A8C9RHF1_SCLFO